MAKDRRIFWNGGGWGDRIEILNRSNDGMRMKVVGWKSPRPRKGDRLHVPMQSGRTAVLKFEDVRLCSDPDDMFFANVKFHHYEPEDGDA